MSRKLEMNQWIFLWGNFFLFSFIIWSFLGLSILFLSWHLIHSPLFMAYFPSSSLVSLHSTTAGELKTLGAKDNKYGDYGPIYILAVIIIDMRPNSRSCAWKHRDRNGISPLYPINISTNYKDLFEAFVGFSCCPLVLCVAMIIKLWKFIWIMQSQTLSWRQLCVHMNTETA